jgi:glycerol-3-phosphate O-acyltransferase
MIAGHELAAIACRVAVASLEAEALAGGAPLDAVVSDSVVHEMRRLAGAAASDRSTSDRDFVRQVAGQLGREGPTAAAALLDTVAARYGAEIAGHFDPRVHRLATRVLPLALSALLNGTSPAQALLRVRELPRIGDRLRLSGELDQLCRLARRGTIVLAPTHVSNLDSVIVGYALFKLGLPPFVYGAGLNLFESRTLGFFMRNLGAYTVDREKTDPLYKRVLKEYATASLERGQHGLFFPGGTRSRSGGLERSLKKGLLGTSITALRRNLSAGRTPQPIFIVPCTLTYPLVLEASGLTEAFLARSGAPPSLELLRTDADRFERWARFLRGVLALDLDIHLRFGRALDPFGCDVDDEGRSLDPRGREVDAAGYLRGDAGEGWVGDAARDAEFTSQLASRILAAYRRDTVATGTALVAFVVFERLRRSLGATSPRRFLGRVGPWTRIARRGVVTDVATALSEIGARAARGEITMAAEHRDGAEAVVARALSTFATYHEPRVLVERGDDILVGQPSLLFYYRNRLDETGLLGGPALLGAGGDA